MAKAQTLLPPALDPNDLDEGADAADASIISHSLQGVGVHAILGAMIEQRRASQVSALELEDEDAPPSEGDAPRAPRSKRNPASDVFLKAR